MKKLLFQLRRYSSASLLNFSGLVLAFTGCYILFTQICFIGNYNRKIEGYECIHKLYVRSIIEKNKWMSHFNRPYLERLKRIPQIESVGYLFSFVEKDVKLDKGGNIITSLAYKANSDMLTTINAKAVDGSISIPDSRESCIVIPASLARKYFGTVKCVGKSVRFKNGKTAQVTGVYKDFPDNSDFRNAVYTNLGSENLHELNNWNYDAYIRLRPDADRKALETALTTLFRDLEKERNNRQELEYIQDVTVSSIPISDTYLYGPNNQENARTIYHFLCFSIMLLIAVALINYANFSMAQAPIRVKGVNIRKVMGESNISLRLRLVAEGVMVSVAAFLLSLVAVFAIGSWEYIDNYIKGTLALQEHISGILQLFGISILVGILATAYSARFITSFPPSLALKGSFGLTPNGKSLRQFLVAFQMILAFIMVIFVSVIVAQKEYIFTSDYGYDKDMLLIGDVRNFPAPMKEKVGNEIEKVNGVQSVSFTQIPLGLQDTIMKWIYSNNGESYTFNVIPVDRKTLFTLGIEIVEGRDFQDGDCGVYIINEAMKRKYPNIKIDKPFIDNLTVVGVCKNFRAFTTRIDNGITPLAFIFFGKENIDWGDLGCLYIRLSADVDKIRARKQIEKVITKTLNGESTCKIRFQDECLEQTYKDEIRFMKQIGVCTILMFVITLIGVFCLTMFETEYRCKEIAIRKVLGSSICEVLALFIRRYMMPLLLSYTIAAPVAYYISIQWLHNFAERTPVRWWIFPLSFLIVSTVVILTVIVQSWRVATMNPVNNLKTE